MKRLACVFVAFLALATAAQAVDPSEMLADPAQEARARAIVKAATYYNDPAKLLEASEELGTAMFGLDIAKLPESELLQTRGW